MIFSFLRRVLDAVREAEAMSRIGPSAEEIRGYADRIARIRVLKVPEGGRIVIDGASTVGHSESVDISPEPKSLPLALLAEPHPEARWVQVELPVGNHGAELIVGAFMIPDSGRPSCWTPAGSIGVERLDPEDEWAIVTNPEIADLAWSQLTFEAYTQLGDSGVR